MLYCKFRVTRTSGDRKKLVLCEDSTWRTLDLADIHRMRSKSMRPEWIFDLFCFFFLQRSCESSHLTISSGKNSLLDGTEPTEFQRNVTHQYNVPRKYTFLVQTEISIQTFGILFCDSADSFPRIWPALSEGGWRNLCTFAILDNSPCKIGFRCSLSS